jgi:BolA protein
MATYLESLKEKINYHLKCEQITLVDNTNLHIQHKFYRPGKYHIKLIIKSNKLKKMKKIDAHKLIFSILKKEVENDIHALEIKII